MKVRAFTVGPMANNTYVVAQDAASQDVVVVDPGLGAEAVADRLQLEGRSVSCVICTHAHLDHVAASGYFAGMFGCPVALHPADMELMQALDEQARWFGVPAPQSVVPELLLEDNLEIPVGRLQLRVLHTPGHSPGHVCLVGDRWLIVGDLIFAGSIGRSDLWGGDYDTLMRSLRERLLTCDDETILYPGHGPASTVGRERASNPYLREGVSGWD